jgi:hypothetical protein
MPGVRGGIRRYAKARFLGDKVGEISALVVESRRNGGE